MKKKSPDWHTYWNEVNDLKYLEDARDNISQIYSDIRNSIGRALMSEEMLELQESLEARIEEIERSKKAA